MTVSDQDKLTPQIAGESDSGGPKRLSVDDNGKINISPNDAIQTSPVDYLGNRPVFGEPSLAAAKNGWASWMSSVVSPLDQKSPTGWLANLYGGVQTGDDWARLNIPVD